jgi:hypothetical protein
MKLLNSRGKVFYGMHFYPGVAEYREEGKDPYRVFLNENTLRTMDASFAGRPIFVDHVDDVEEDIDELKSEADGWVVKSFYNEADGKHWAQMVLVSKRAIRAVERGLRLSNAYVPTQFSQGGTWNGVEYNKEITAGEFEHLAIVANPRYEESVIMTPEQFKAYNDEQRLELKRLANSKEQENEKMSGKLQFWKRAKVENAADLEGVCVQLPKSKKEMSVVELVEAHDAILNMHGYANTDHMVKLHDGSEMKVGELLEKHKTLADEITAMKAKNEESSEADLETEEEGVDSESTPAEKNAEDEEADAKKKKDEDAAKKNAADAKAKAAKLKNAHLRSLEQEQEVAVELSGDMVARGKARYGAK